MHSRARPASTNVSKFVAGLLMAGLATAACTNSTMPDGMCNHGFPGPSGIQPCILLEVSPKSGAFGSVLLKGDTLVLSAVSILEQQPQPASWSIPASSLSAVVNGALTQSVAGPVSQIVVTGNSTGGTTVTATYAPKGLSGSTYIYVRDSSYITEMTMGVSPTTIKAGQAAEVVVSLKDAGHTSVRASPESVYTTNATIATVLRTRSVLMGSPTVSFILQAHAPGTVGVVADFLALRQTLSVTIAP